MKLQAIFGVYPLDSRFRVIFLGITGGFGGIGDAVYEDSRKMLL